MRDLALLDSIAEPAFDRITLLATRLLQVPVALVSLVDADRQFFKSSVNLLSNAVKFTPEGGRIGLEISGDAVAGVVTFTVWDTGIGIGAANLARIFRPFEQLDNGLAREYNGTGLGLALVHQLARLQYGNVTVESNQGSGSRFTITLPGPHGTSGPDDTSLPGSVLA